MTSSSNLACKMYDAALTQFIGFYDDPNLGGLGKTVEKMLHEDPDFGKSLCYRLNQVNMF